MNSENNIQTISQLYDGDQTLPRLYVVTIDTYFVSNHHYIFRIIKDEIVCCVIQLYVNGCVYGLTVPIFSLLLSTMNCI